MAAYMLAVCKITNMKPEMKEYAEKSCALCIAHGGKYLIRGMAKEDYEGDLLEGKLVILTEFPSMDDLQTFIRVTSTRIILSTCVKGPVNIT